MPQIGLRVSDALAAQIDRRGGERAEVVREALHSLFGMEQEFGAEIREGGPSHSWLRRDLTRYHELLQRERRSLRDLLTPNEQALIVDFCNGTFWDAGSIPLLWASAEDAVRLDGLDGKWRVDGPALVAKLKALSYAGSAALIDAAERFWGRVSAGEQPDPRKLLEETIARAERRRQLLPEDTDDGGNG